MSARQTAVADCYSARERAAMVRSQRLRQRLFRPVLVALDRCGATPDGLTVASLVAGLSFCPLLFWSKSAALAALAIHVLIDGLDGPLARHRGLDGRRGSFTDTTADQVVVVASTVTLMSAGFVGVVPGSVYVAVYTVVVGFAMIRNALAIPYSWLWRPRFVVYGWLAVEFYVWPGTIDPVIWIANAALAPKLLTGFVRIRSRI